MIGERYYCNIYQSYICLPSNYANFVTLDTIRIDQTKLFQDYFCTIKTNSRHSKVKILLKDFFKNMSRLLQGYSSTTLWLVKDHFKSSGPLKEFFKITSRLLDLDIKYHFIKNFPCSSISYLPTYLLSLALLSSSSFLFHFLNPVGNW